MAASGTWSRGTYRILWTKVVGSNGLDSGLLADTDVISRASRGTRMSHGLDGLSKPRGGRSGEIEFREEVEILKESVNGIRRPPCRIG